MSRVRALWHKSSTLFLIPTAHIPFAIEQLSPIIYLDYPVFVVSWPLAEAGCDESNPVCFVHDMYIVLHSFDEVSDRHVLLGCVNGKENVFRPTGNCFAMTRIGQEAHRAAHLATIFLPMPVSRDTHLVHSRYPTPLIHQVCVSRLDVAPMNTYCRFLESSIFIVCASWGGGLELIDS